MSATATNNSLSELFGHDASSIGLADAARAYLSCRKLKEEAESLVRTQADILNSAEDTLLQKMQEAGVLSVKVEDESGRPTMVSAGASTYYNLPQGALEDREIYVWLLAQGGQDLVKRSIHHASFSSFCRELVDAGRNLHPAVKVTEKKVVRVKKD